MGTSFVRYGDYGFWTPDAYLGSWLGSLVGELQSVVLREEWQEQLIKHWRIQMGIDGGVMWVGLDDFLIDDARREFVLVVAKRALDHSQPLGLRTGQLFIDLLAGRLKTTVSSPIDYLERP